MSHEHLDVESADAGPTTETDVIDDANVLAAQARPHLADLGIGEDRLVTLAHEYLGVHGDRDLDAFVTWVRARPEGSSA